MEFQRVQWPERTCREPVHGRYQSYTCELPDLHRGPCVSLSVKDSITRRNMWEESEKAPETLQTDESEATTP